MIRDVLFIFLGYTFGSILFAKIFGKLFCGKDITKNAIDKNPGTTNAFLYGGFACGTATLACDILKGFLPIMIYRIGNHGFLQCLVIAAPVIGHIFPIFFKFRGGKGIATTFGCLLGLFPQIAPAAALAVWFIFFSSIIRVSPHYYRTIVAYLAAEISMIACKVDISFIIGFTVITVLTIIRMIAVQEEKGALKVGFLWMR